MRPPREEIAATAERRAGRAALGRCLWAVLAGLLLGCDSQQPRESLAPRVIDLPPSAEAPKYDVDVMILELPSEALGLLLEPGQGTLDDLFAMTKKWSALARPDWEERLGRLSERGDVRIVRFPTLRSAVGECARAGGQLTIRVETDPQGAEDGGVRVAVRLEDVFQGERKIRTRVLAPTGEEWAVLCGLRTSSFTEAGRTVGGMDLESRPVPKTDRCWLALARIAKVESEAPGEAVEEDAPWLCLGLDRGRGYAPAASSRSRSAASASSGASSSARW